MSAEAESIADGVVDGSFLQFPEGEIDFRVDIRVVGEVVDCRRHDIIFAS